MAAPVVAAPVAVAAGAKSVTLTIDGVSREVTTAGDTVREVLATRTIELDRHDTVTPSPDSAIEEGDRVTVRLGRKLDLEVDGEQETHWVHATNVGGALREIGRTYPDADMSALPSQPIGRKGMNLTVRTEKRITLVQAGVTTKEVTTGVTVREALADIGVPYDGDDKVEPGLDTAVEDGTRIRLVRLDERTQRVRQTIPNETVVRYDDTMLEGESKVLRKGRDGVRLVTYDALLADGEVRRRRTLDERVLVRPVDRVEVHGTKAAISGAPCPDGSSVESGLTENSVAVYRAACARFPEVDTWGGLRPGDTGDHGTGRAVDIMVYSDSALGDAIAAWLQDNASRLGISEVIWAQRIWSVERSSEGWRWMEDRGSTTANHYDHVHVSVY